MSKSNKEDKANKEILANIKKNGFIVYADRLRTACENLDDPGLGRVFRQINEYVHNPAHVATFTDSGENMTYKFFVDAVRDNTEDWKKRILDRRKRYEEEKRKNAANFDNSDNSANFDNSDNSAETAETSEPENLKNQNCSIRKEEYSNSSQSSSQLSSQSSQATTNVVSSTSKKEFQINNLKIFSDKEYTKKYLNEKKIYFKSDEAFERFFDFNLNDCHWCYKPETAARRWFKNNPEDKGQPPIPKKEAPQPPTTPAELTEKREQIWDAIRDQVPFTDFKSYLEPLQLLKIQETIDGDNIQLGFKNKWHGEYFGTHLQKFFRQTYFALTCHQVNKIEGCFVDTSRKELLWFQFLTNEEFKQKQQEANEKAAAEKAAAEAQAKKNREARERVMDNLLHNKKTIPNVYADPAPKPTPAPAEIIK